MNYAEFRARFKALKNAKLKAEEELYPKSDTANVTRPTERAAFARAAILAPSEDNEPLRFVLSNVERRLLYYDKQWIRERRCTCANTPKEIYVIAKETGRLVRMMSYDRSVCICCDAYDGERLRYLSERALVPVYQITTILDQINATFARAETAGLEVEFEYTAVRVYRNRARERKVA